MSGRLGPSGLRARRQRNLTKRNRAKRWRGMPVEMQKKELAERIEDMARKTREQRHAAHRKAVEAEKRELRQAMKSGGHHYFAEWYRHYRKNGDIAIVDAMEELWDELVRHDREHPAPRNFGMDDGYERARDLKRRRREARDNERVAEIAEGARRKAAGIGGGSFATAAPESELEMDDEPDPQAEEYEGRRRALMGHGLVSRMPAPPQQPRKKKRKGYYGPPLVG